jgi:xanthine dehydrogenase large subunit
MNNLDSINHVSGKSVYVDDIAAQKGTLHGAVLGSPIAYGKIISIDHSQALSFPGVEKILTHADVPGRNQIGGIVEDEPLFAEGEVHFQGQPIALVVAHSELAARKAVELIRLELEELTPVTDPREAMAKGLLLIPPRTFRMGNIDGAWAECDFIFEGRVETGGQEHLYIETQGLTPTGRWRRSKGSFLHPGANPGTTNHRASAGVPMKG